MGLSNDLISQFVKATNDNSNDKADRTVYGTIVNNGDRKYVQLDGSDQLTPFTSTSDFGVDDRVIVLIKNHTATVIGNITSPAARSADVKNAVDASAKISEFETVLATKVDTEQLNAANARIDTLNSDTVLIKKQLLAAEGTIETLTSDNVTIKESLTAASGDIETLKTSKLDASSAEITYAKVSDLEATNATINNLDATNGQFHDLATDKFNAIDAKIKQITADQIDVTELEAKFANIDFSNIGKAAMEYFYANSGLIEDVTIGDATISGKLIGVTISGDLIEGNTVVADKLVIKGDDGLYYKLNTSGEGVSTEQTDYNSLNGTVIKAKSVTAEKISVTDLVAFDATIGGFNITDSAIYSGVKESADNTTRGIYLDKEGQFVVGDSNSFIKYYKDTDDTHKLAISAESIKMGTGGDAVDLATAEGLESSDQAREDLAKDFEERINNVQAFVEILRDSLSLMVQDENGASLMEQTETGWVFSMGETLTQLQDAANTLRELSENVDSQGGSIEALEHVVTGLEELSNYVRITTVGDEPAIELGNESSFKVRITNTAIQFMDGTTVPAYVSNQSLKIEKAEVEQELAFGGFSFAERSNGNMGLMWKGGS